MKVKLVKTGQDYILYSESKETLAISNGGMVGRVLSLKNCQSIENGYDLDELGNEHCNRLYYEGNVNWDRYRLHFKEGFKKALEILGDKKFSEEDVIKAINLSWQDKPMLKIENIIQSLQQTEWDVEIEMECKGGCKYLVLNGINSICCGDKTPKLDKDGCLILRRI